MSSRRSWNRPSNCSRLTRQGRAPGSAAALRLLLVLCVACLAALPACAPVSQPRFAGPAPEAAAIIQRLQDRRQAVKTLQLQGQVEIETRGNEVLGDHLIVGRAPDSLRADIMGPFGRPEMSLALNQGVVTVLAFGENRAYRGPASPANLGRFLGVALDGAALFDLLTGVPPIMAHDRAEVELPADSQVAKLKLTDSGSGLVQVLEVHLGDYAVNQTWIGRADGPVSFRCEYSDFRISAGGRLPFRTEVSDDRERRVSLINSEIKINPAVNDKVFELAIPSVMNVEPLP